VHTPYFGHVKYKYDSVHLAVLCEAYTVLYCICTCVSFERTEAIKTPIKTTLSTVPLYHDLDHAWLQYQVLRIEHIIWRRKLHTDDPICPLITSSTSSSSNKFSLYFCISHNKERETETDRKTESFFFPLLPLTAFSQPPPKDFLIRIARAEPPAAKC
jgi:hypothetical protein